jgi:glutamate formiminotransferase / 5-formyltetrahydrofolate cyclo-ligase
MPLLTVPNWSLGRERSVLREAFDFLAAAPVTVHYAEADIDHNRTVTAFSGTPTNVQQTLLSLAEIFLPCINLQRHTGVHPRIGGLDVCPFIPLPEPKNQLDLQNLNPVPSADAVPPSLGEEGVGKQTKYSNEENTSTSHPNELGGNKAGVEYSSSVDLNKFITQTAQFLADAHNIPIYLYEHSAPGKTLPNLRKGGFGALINQELHPDFGPNQAHPHLGATVLGWRDFLVALNINFVNQPGAGDIMRQIASHIREKRRKGDPLFAGVRALGLELQAQEIAQLSLNITQPDTTDFDKIITTIEEFAGKSNIIEGYPQLIGVIRDIDIERSTKIFARPEQVVQTRLATNWTQDWT